MQFDMPEGQLIALTSKYPDGFKRYKLVNGRQEECYMALVKNLYGVPSAGRNWERTRNRELLNKTRIQKCIDANGGRFKY